jgi:peptide/nickel transport system substrate-binding protein
MSMRHKIAIGAVLAAIVSAGVTAATVTAGSNKSTSTGKSLKGGTYRLGWEAAFGFTDGLDPTGEYLGDAIAILNNVLVRTLVGTNHTPGAAGNKLVPDLATSVPQPTNGGSTYTFRLKSGLKWAPPVNRAITSKDVLYAMQRLAIPKNGGQYAFYYGVIKGFDDFGAGKAKTISGITTPNPSTIVFNLTKPTGDFLYRLAMPAAGPIPEEVAKCFDGKPGAYGRNLVSSAAYMIKGSDQVNISSCDTIKPASGFDGETELTLVRNPNYNPATDTRAARENNPDSIVWTVNSNADDIYNKVKAGDLEDEVASEPPKVLREYVTDPSLKPRLHQFFGDRTWYITMNLSQPPFDDIHVRKAMNWVTDKNALRKAWGGPVAGPIANHIVPDTLFGFKLQNYKPYLTPGDHGSVAKAKAEMKLSKYDTNHDGVCDAKVCKKVLMISDARNQDPGIVASLQATSGKIGITYTVRTIPGAYPTIQTPRKNIPIAERPGWGKDYPDAITFFQPLFDGRTIIPTGNTNYSLVGITPAIAKKVGAKGNLANIPSIGGDIDKCSVLSGDPRRICFQNLDKKLMEQVVPWIPYLWSFATNITGPTGKSQFDQFAGSLGYAHVAVTS